MVQNHPPCYKIVAYTTSSSPQSNVVYDFFLATASSCENEHWRREETGMAVATNVTSSVGCILNYPEFKLYSTYNMYPFNFYTFIL